MKKEIFKLNDLDTGDYESFCMKLTVQEFMETCHSSNIQRLRNPKKEEGIMRTIKDSLESKETPFFQPFILHYSGKISNNGNNPIIEPQKQFKVQIETDKGLKDAEYEFEVIDGNGRLNALIRLTQNYADMIAQTHAQIEGEDSKQKIKRLRNKIYDLKTQYKNLKEVVIVAQVYLNLDITQKTRLFNSVNQGEKMTLGRLQVYNKDKLENRILSNYILHTESIENFPYIITPDKDVLRTAYDRSTYVPAVYLLPVIRQLIKYCKVKDIEDREWFIFKALDHYIINAINPPQLRKHFFSIFRSVVNIASGMSCILTERINDLIRFNYSEFDDISKELKNVRAAALAFVFANISPEEEENADGPDTKPNDNLNNQDDETDLYNDGSEDNYDETKDFGDNIDDDGLLEDKSEEESFNTDTIGAH